MNKLVRIVVLIAAIALMLLAGYKLYETVSDYSIAGDAYGNTVEQYVKKKQPVEKTDEYSAGINYSAPSAANEGANGVEANASGSEKPEELQLHPKSGSNDWSGYAVPAPILVDFETLLQENDDFKGWLYCEDTPINYPVMQGKDNTSYLHNLPDGTYNFSGSLFIEQNNEPNLSDVNTIIYGHSMKNGTMFGSIINYAKQKYYDEHPVLWYLTPSGDFRLDVVYGLTIPADNELYKVYYNMESYLDILEKYAEKSTFESGIEIGESDRIIMLSTCSHAYDNARYVLICRLVPCMPEWALNEKFNGTAVVMD